MKCSKTTLNLSGCVMCRSSGIVCDWAPISQDSLSLGTSATPANSKPREVWGHLGENERQPGRINTDYDEVTYTLHINKDDPEYKARKAAAAGNIATQAEQSTALNSYVAEKRLSEDVGAGDSVAGKER